jgi:hypothetical protein
MRNLTTRAMIVERYGMRLSIEQLAELLGVTPHSVYQQAVDGSFPIRTYKEGRRRFASYEAVAEYLDGKDDEAAEVMKKKPGR